MINCFEDELDLKMNCFQILMYNLMKTFISDIKTGKKQISIICYILFIYVIQYLTMLLNITDQQLQPTTEYVGL